MIDFKLTYSNNCNLYGEIHKYDMSLQLKDSYSVWGCIKKFNAAGLSTEQQNQFSNTLVTVT